ncbi:hypothetical protein B0H11DRAFT_2258227 [Mycena galericulata]|nr:hypothetical protein B0H11DRAFT_2258227 [Mycena galericulata]
MYDLHRMLNGEFPTPIYSVKRQISWISFGASPDDIPFAAADYMDTLELPTAVAVDGTRMDMDQESSPLFLDPEFFYRGYAPCSACSSGSVDKLSWLLTNDVDLDSHLLANFARRNPPFAEYSIDETFQANIIGLSVLLDEANRSIASRTDFYGADTSNWPAIKVPNMIDQEKVSAKHESQHEAYDAAATARRAVLDQLGFLYWLLTVNENWHEGLPTALSQFITDLRLFERRKRGMLLRLERDYPRFNFVHMILQDSLG